MKIKTLLKRYRGRAGFTIVETLVATGLITLSMGAAAGLVDLYNKSSRQLNALRAISNYRSLLVETLSSYSGWQATMISDGSSGRPDNGPELGCLRFNSVEKDCTTSTALNTDRPISVITGDNDLFFDGKNPSAGFRYDGRNCDPSQAFVPPGARGNDECPLRYEVRVRLICPLPVSSDTCVNPEILVSGRLLHNPATPQVQLNPDRWSFSFIRGLDRNTVRRACEAAGGSYLKNPTTQAETCNLPYAGNCPPGFYVAGIDLEPGRVNQKVCRSIVGRCADGQLMRGLNPDGTPRCESAMCSIQAPPPDPPPPPVPPSGPAFWDGGSSDGCGGVGAGC